MLLIYHTLQEEQELVPSKRYRKPAVLFPQIPRKRHASRSCI